MAPTIISVFCLLLVFLSARVESGTNWYNMFMFGDSFAYNGNGPTSSTGLPTRLSRAWFDPYGCNYEDYNGHWQGNNPSGRFSDFMVQSDVIAKIMGFHEAAPAYKQSVNFCHPYGMTLATVGAGVYKTPDKAPTLGQQINTFKGLVHDGFISSTRLEGAFVLVAISGKDYVPKINLLSNTISPTSITPLTPYIENVTNEIVTNVHRLQKLGARKILVKNMHPLGCMPRHTRVNNHTRCQGHGNFIASAHNSMLQRKLGNDRHVHIVDLYTAFTNVINNVTTDSQRFTFKLAPSCEANAEGFCGYRDDRLDHFYVLDDDHLFRHFYWDDMHPTSAGWKAVMKQLEGSIKLFMSS